MTARLSKLDGAELGESLTNIVKSKQVESKTQVNGEKTKNDEDEESGDAMFDADAEAAQEEERNQAKEVESSNELKPPDKGGGGEKGHQRMNTVEILGKGKA